MMHLIAFATLRGIVRDRVLHGIGGMTIFFFLIPSISSLSMRQVTELSITISLSFASFILLFLAVFLGGTQLWKDVERRYTYSVLSLPMSRSSYLMGKYLSVALFTLLVSIILVLASIIVVIVSSTMYTPERSVMWGNIVLCVFFDALKALLLIAFAFLFSTVSTSFFLPVFGTIAIYFAGNASQQVYEYVVTGGGKQLPEVLRIAAKVLYYILPNLSSFDLKTFAIYAVPPDVQGLWATGVYFIVYTAIVLVCASIVFSRKEMN